jgi:hypothetical protein
MTGSREWAERAKGWFQVMYLDAVMSMVVYTIVTAAFYLLGAAVLHSGGTVPEGYQMVETLSRIFTETLGSVGEEYLSDRCILRALFYIVYRRCQLGTRMGRCIRADRLDAVRIFARAEKEHWNIFLGVTGGLVHSVPVFPGSREDGYPRRHRHFGTAAAGRIHIAGIPLPEIAGRIKAFRDL